MALSVQSEVKQISSVEQELSVVVPGADVAKELDRAYRDLGQKVQLKGFRRGKVPRYVLEQYYKKETEQQVMERLLGRSFQEAIKTHAINPVANPKIQAVPELIAGMDFRYQAKVETKPTFELQHETGLSVTRTRYVVRDAAIERQINQLREEHAKVVPLEGRETVQQGDVVDIDWSGTVDGEPVKGLSGIGKPIEVGAGAFTYKELEQALVGKSKGEKVSVDVILPENFPLQALRGKTALLSAQILELKQKTLPNVDDEFAKDVDDQVESLEALRAKIRENLQKEADDISKKELHDAAIKAMIEKNPFEVPQSLVDQQAERIAIEKLQGVPQQLAEMLWQQRGQQMKSDAQPLAIQQVRSTLILEALAKKEGIVVSDDDVRAEYQKIADRLAVPFARVVEAYGEKNREAELRFRMTVERAMDFLIKNAVVAEVEADYSA